MLRAVRSGRWKLLFEQGGGPAALYALDIEIGETGELRRGAASGTEREGDQTTGGDLVERPGRRCHLPEKAIPLNLSVDIQEGARIGQRPERLRRLHEA